MEDKELNYNALGLKVGLEIHQQLNTKHKLFCSCPTELADEKIGRELIERYLKATKSEVGEIDPAALYEMRKGRKIIYEVPEGHACLVEMDEEPPHEVNEEALVITLAIAKALHSTPVDEVYVMRKIVIDGSNTTGFQRTAIVALGGKIDDLEGPIRIQTICLEEDAARKVSEGEGFIRYNLDRLGIPLIEISTSPDIKSPEQAMRVALKLGLLMRLTGKVKRGLGTIRQDLNISIRGGVKTEVKGVSKLELIPKVIRYEVMRQLNLLKIRDELRRRGIDKDFLSNELIDITDILLRSKSRLVLKMLKRGLKAYAIGLRGFKGILGWELQPNRRFGSELSDYAKAWGGVKGVIHSDELPKYGITEEIVKEIFSQLSLNPSSDAFLFVLAERERAERALNAVIERVKEALHEIPRETRGANPDGTTRYLRPQPGAARMYPETDIPPVRITEEILNRAEKIKPPTPDEMLSELIKKYGLSKELANQLIRDPYITTFLDLVMELPNVRPQLIASTLLIHLKGLKSEGLDIEGVKVEDLKQLLSLVGSNAIAKEAIPEILKIYLSSKGNKPIQEIVKDFKSLNQEELNKIVEEVLESYKDEIIKRGEKAFSFIMGKVMSEVRGKASGEVVANIVREKLLKITRK